MSTLARALQAIDDESNAKPSDLALPGNTPTQFDASLVAQLTVQYDELDAMFRTAVSQFESDPDTAERVMRECAEQLLKLRHIEAIRLYPIIGRSIWPDPVARRLFWQSRLVMLGLARRVLRRFEDVTRAMRSATVPETAVDHFVKALAEYRQRNETEIYPL
ncbi:MAG TPA: hypothetical protein VHQ21_14350, partial [Rhodanobacteraceae bacterium]|nr:hypothetical protein [Rhodanobacteraceae bacterium]